MSPSDSSATIPVSANIPPTPPDPAPINPSELQIPNPISPLLQSFKDKLALHTQLREAMRPLQESYNLLHAGTIEAYHNSLFGSTAEIRAAAKVQYDDDIKQMEVLAHQIVDAYDRYITNYFEMGWIYTELLNLIPNNPTVVENPVMEPYYLPPYYLELLQDPDAIIA